VDAPHYLVPVPRPTARAVLGVVAGLVVVIAGVVVLTRGRAPATGDAATGPAGSGAAVGVTVEPPPHPNIVVIMTDDQTLEEVRVMDHVRELADRGASFSHYYASFPNCCPSRATYLTGQLAHNNGVIDNVPPHGGAHKLADAETLPVWLQRAGYYTAHVGKYLNSWGQNGDITPPPGWSRWFGLVDPTTYHYFDYDVSVDGTRVHHGHEDADYSTDVLGAEVVEQIGVARKKGAPFFISFTPLAPHVQSAERSDLEFKGVSWPLAVPAPRHTGEFAQEPLPKTASWNEPRGGVKPGFIQQRRALTPSDEQLATTSYRLELETLQAVDEWIGKIEQAVRDQGVADSTYLLFTSDNGLYHGEHRIPNGKLYLYEPAVHLPLVVAGPAIGAGVQVDAPAGNVDLAPTIARLAGATPGVAFDGRDLFPLIQDPSRGKGRGMLLENYLGGQVLSDAIHTERWFYGEANDGTRELYDLAVDPDQVRNVAGAATYAPVQADLQARLATARSCAGATCEGSDASGGQIPTGVDVPVPEGTVSTTEPRSIDSLPTATVQRNVYEALDALTPTFDLTEPEKACVVKALTAKADTIGTDGRPVLQDRRALANAVTLAESCIGPVRKARGIAAVAPILSDGVVAGGLAICLGDALAKLDPVAFTAALDLLVDLGQPDPEARAAMEPRLRACGADPATVFPR